MNKFLAVTIRPTTVFISSFSSLSLSLLFFFCFNFLFLDFGSKNRHSPLLAALGLLFFQVRGKNRCKSKLVLLEKNLHMNNQGSQNVATCKPVTTFVQTDTNTFREIVQRLTGPSENNAAAEAPEPTVNKTAPAPPKRPTSKLHERRQCMRPKLEIVKPPLSFKPTGTTPSSKSGTTTPSSLFSNLSLIEGEKAEPDNIEEEEKAIKERRFYLHPSPRSKPGYTEPELLTLFPLTSPNSSGGP